MVNGLSKILFKNKDLDIAIIESSLKILARICIYSKFQSCSFSKS